MDGWLGPVVQTFSAMTYLDALALGVRRKDFAALAVTHPLRWALFLRLDGKDV